MESKSDRLSGLVGRLRATEGPKRAQKEAEERRQQEEAARLRKLGEAHGRQYAEEVVDDVNFFRKAEELRPKGEDFNFWRRLPAVSTFLLSAVRWEDVAGRPDDDVRRSREYQGGFLAGVLSVWDVVKSQLEDLP
jgi:hypothetical protein